jgi:secretion/DNA translocation related CpaE-like protein
VIIATRTGDDQALWKEAVELGAEQVVVLPEGESWLVDRLAGLTDGLAPDAPVVAVIGGRGGAGATTFAAAIAVTAARAGHRVSAVDLDPMGSGLDVTLGSDCADGLRWGDIARTRGRVPPSLLADGLLSVDGVRVLTWSPGPCEVLWPGAAGAAIDALRRVSDVVVVDLPRTPSDSVGEAICRATRVLVVVPKDTHSLSASARLVTSPVLVGAELRLVTRGPSPAGLSASEIAQVLCIPVLADIRYEQSLGRNLEMGLAPGDGRRSPLGRAGRMVLTEVGVGSGSATGDRGRAA